MSMVVEEIYDGTRWSEVLQSFRSHDFVHTFDFHRLSQQNGEGAPALFCVRNFQGKAVACWPGLKREVPGTDCFDLTSVYGYGGPLFAEDADPCLALDYIFGGMRKAGVISVFSRMHPIFTQKIPVDEYRGIKLGDVVVIDVEPVTHPISNYRGSHRREIVKSLREGVRIIVDRECVRLDDFIGIYQQTMRDLDAPEYYLFNREYFRSLKTCKDFETIIVFAEFDDMAIAASMFIITGEIMQYYLSGTVAAFKKFSPSKAIILRAHELAIELGVKKLILGGGVGSSEDALFKFKTGFSRLTMPFYITKRILSEDRYEQACADKGVDPSATSYFPAYRAH